MTANPHRPIRDFFPSSLAASAPLPAATARVVVVLVLIIIIPRATRPRRSPPRPDARGVAIALVALVDARM